MQKLGNIESDINGIKSELGEMKETAARIETKQQIIFENTAKLSEYHFQGMSN